MSSMIPRTRPGTPRSGSAWSDAQHTHGLLSPAHSIDGQLVLGQHQDAESPFRGFWLDWHELRKGHPTRDVGVDILQDLSDVRLTPNARYPEHRHIDPRCTVDFGRMTRTDIKAVQMDASLVVADLRTDRAREEQPLVDGDDVRQAVHSGQPIIFRAEAQRNGLRSARLDIPYYTIGHLGRTLVGGEGAFYTKLPAYYTDVIFTQTVGKCLLVTFPQTPENAASTERVPSPAEQRQWIRWALLQPGVNLRILLPGDSAFLSRDHLWFIMCLGHGESRYSATSHLYVTHDHPERQRHLTHGRERRKHTSAKPYDRPSSTPPRETVDEATVQSQPSPVPQSSNSRGECSQASDVGNAGNAARASSPSDTNIDSAPHGSSERRWPPTNPLDVEPRSSHHPEPSSPPRGELNPAAHAGHAAHASPAASTSNHSELSVVPHSRRSTPSPIAHDHAHAAESSGNASPQISPANPASEDAASSGRSLWDRVDQRNLYRRY